MRDFISGVTIIWYRDLLRFWRNKTRVFTGFSFPVLWLFVFGNGISASLSLPVPDVKFIQFLYPGIIAQFVIFTAIFSAISILQDREFGFLKEVLVSPVSRTAIAVGKILGGATTTTLQAAPLIVLGPFVGIPISAGMVVALAARMFVLALCLSALGVAVTSKMKSLEAGQYVFQFVSFPLVMFSGAVFPLQRLPEWLDTLVKVNPVSYGVDFLRRAVFDALALPHEAVAALSPTIGGEIVPGAVEALIVGGFTAALAVLAVHVFRRA